MAKNTAAFGIYQNRADVEFAVEELKKEDFRNTDISVLFPYNQSTKDFAVEKHTKVPEVTATRATSGGSHWRNARMAGGYRRAGDPRNWSSGRSGTKRAKQIMQRTSAQDVSSTSEAKADFQKTDKPLQRAS